MYYAIIIIVALAIAFIILIRRLPSATSLENGRVEKPASPRPPIKFPSFRRPQTQRPAPASVPTSALPQTTQPARTRRKPMTLPRFRFPWPKPRAAKPSKEATQEVQEKKEDFWQAETPLQPLHQSVMKQVENEPKTAQKTQTKDSLQQAEDLFAIRDYKRAEKLYLRLATEDPRNAKIYSRLGIIYLEQKNFEDARDALQQAIKLEPHVATRHFNLSLVYLELNSRAKAIAEMEAALKYEPANRKYRKMLDEILGHRN